jgi:hypothetical protein
MSFSATMAYRRNSESVLCPESCIAVTWATPAATMFRQALRLKSWNRRRTPESRQAVAQLLRNSRIGSPARWNINGDTIATALLVNPLIVLRRFMSPTKSPSSGIRRALPFFASSALSRMQSPSKSSQRRDAISPLRMPVSQANKVKSAKSAGSLPRRAGRLHGEPLKKTLQMSARRMKSRFA